MQSIGNKFARRWVATWVSWFYCATFIVGQWCSGLPLWSEDPPRPPMGRPGGNLFEQRAPKVGDRVPDMVLYDAEGKPVQLGEIRGHYTVLIFGCLT